MPGTDMMIRAVGTFLEAEGRFLILLRVDGRWGLPGGLIEPGEEDEQAAAREILEETGLVADKEGLEPVAMIRRKKSDGILYYCAYALRLPKMFAARLDMLEHRDFRWVTPEECMRLPHLIHDFRKLIRIRYKF